MIALPSRHRSLFLLTTVVVAQILLLAVQIKRERKVRLIRVWAVELISPIQGAGRWTIDHLSGGWSNYIALRNAGRENQELRSELERLKLRNAELEGRAVEADRLSGLLGFRQTHTEVPMLAARVISASPDPNSRVVYINRGERDGVRKNMGVITPEGVVGKIIEAYRNTSEVLLLSDKESGVGALLAGTRTQSPVGGTGEPLLLLKYIGNDEEVRIGATVLTSGQDRIFPRDLPVGTVVDTRPGNPFKIIHVRPAAHLDRLEEVIVLLTLQELDLKKEPAQAAAKPGGAAAKIGATPVKAAVPGAASAKNTAPNAAKNPAANASKSGDATAPKKSDNSAAGSPDKPAARGTGKPTAPPADKPAAPGAEKPPGPGADKPPAPSGEKPPAPGAEKPVTKPPAPTGPPQ